MQLSSTNTLSHLQTNTLPGTPQKPQELTAEQRELAAGVASQRSTTAQIDAYVAGAQSSSSSTTETSTVQDYTDFAADVRRANGFETVVQNRDEETRPEAPAPTSQQGRSDTSVQQAQGIAESTSIADRLQRDEQISIYAQNSTILEELTGPTAAPLSNQLDISL